jgi:hypothetical protein
MEEGKRRRMMNVLTEIKTTSPAKTWSTTPLQKEDKIPDDDNNNDVEAEALNTTLPLSPVNSPKDFDTDSILNNIFSEKGTTKNNEANDGTGSQKSDTKNSDNENEYDSEGDGDFSADEESLDSTSKLMDENLALRASCKISENSRLKLLKETKEKDTKIDTMEAEISCLKGELQSRADEIKALTEKLKQEERKGKDPGEVASLKEENKSLISLVAAAGELLQSGSTYIS